MSQHRWRVANRMKCAKKRRLYDKIIELKKEINLLQKDDKEIVGQRDEWRRGASWLGKNLQKFIEEIIT